MFFPFLLKQLTPCLLPLSWQAFGWLGHHCLGDWGDDVHACMRIHNHTQSQTWKCDRLSFMSKLLHSVAPWKVASQKKRQVLRLSCHSEGPQLFHPSTEMDGSGFPFHSVKFSSVIPNWSWASAERDKCSFKEQSSRLRIHPSISLSVFYSFVSHIQTVLLFSDQDW